MRLQLNRDRSDPFPSQPSDADRLAQNKFPMKLRALLFFALCFAPACLRAEEPAVSYIFPAGGQRGTTVKFHVGGLNLHGNAGFEMLGAGVSAAARIVETNTLWFEGPVIPQPPSQAKEDYPRDYAGEVRIAADAAPGPRAWRTWTAQGATPAMKFIVGTLPEVLERERDGEPIPVAVNPPVTINGRIFPRENVDVWTFAAKAGQEFTCRVEAQSLGSPLLARLVLVDPRGREIAEANATQRGDPQLAFRAAVDGEHRLRIHDLNFGGLQNYVYRLTITGGPWINSVYPLGAQRGKTVTLALAGQALPQGTLTVAVPADAPDALALDAKFGNQNPHPVSLEVSDFPEFLVPEPNSAPAPVLKPVTPPAVFNGRIELPGDVDFWPLQLKKNEAVEITASAGRLGSAMTPVLTIHGVTNRILQRAETAAGDTADASLTFKAPEDGVYHVRVAERFASRGGPNHAYRLRVGPASAPDFQLQLGADVLRVLRETADGPATETKKPRAKQKPGQLQVNVVRTGGFTGEIELTVEGLPANVSAAATKIAANKPNADVNFSAEYEAKIGAQRVRVIGKATVDGKPVTRTATLPGQPPIDSVLLAVALPTPFKTTSDFLLAYVPRGSTARRPYRIERGGFTGPLYVRLADRQGRHLQGVTGPTLTLGPEVEAFDYPVTLPTFLEIGRTSRTAILVWGVVRDHDGTEHVVSYSANEQNDQVIILPEPGLLTLDLERPALLARPNETAEVRLKLTRARSLKGTPVRLELLCASHISGVSAEPVTIPGEKTEAVLKVRFGARPGPFNLPATIRGTAILNGATHVAEVKLELAPATSANAR